MKKIIKELRINNNLTQEKLASRLNISRQAVSRWEQGETVPNIDTLKIISKEFNISINILLGSPRALICQCCGMPLIEDEHISKEIDKSFNEDFCKWCYDEGEYKYDNIEELINISTDSMVEMNPEYDKEQVRIMLSEMLPKLSYWRDKK